MKQFNDSPLDPVIQAVISSLYREAKGDTLKMAMQAAKAAFKPVTPSDLGSIYMSISQEQGEFIYHTIVEHGCKTIVEFGTSFGISTLFLAAGAKKTGGTVITTEIISSKADQARKNFEKAGVSELIDLRIGDALDTLKGLKKPVDFLLLDGWKNLYLPLFKQLESQFAEGTIIYSDNMNMADAKPLLEYIRLRSHTYMTQTIHQGKAELTIRK